MKTTQHNGAGPSKSVLETNRALRRILGDVMDGVRVHYIGPRYGKLRADDDRSFTGWAHDTFDVLLPDGTIFPWESSAGHRQYFRSGKPEEHPEYGIMVAQDQRMVDHPPSRDFDAEFLMNVRDSPFQWRRYIMTPSYADILYHLRAKTRAAECSIDELAQELGIYRLSEALRIHTAAHENMRAYNNIVPHDKREAVADILWDYWSI